MPQALIIHPQELVIRALENCLQMLQFNEKGAGEVRIEMATKLYNMCSADICEFQDYILNKLPNRLHFGEPLLLAVTVLASKKTELERQDWITIQSYLGDIVTDEWLDAHKEEATCNG